VAGFGEPAPTPQGVGRSRALTKNGVALKAVQTAKNRQMHGFESLPLRDQMRSAMYAKEDVVKQLAETLNLDAVDVAQLVQNAPALTPRPPSAHY